MAAVVLRRPYTFADLQMLSAHDRELYPTAKPVEPEQMRLWLQRCPDFGSVYFLPPPATPNTPLLHRQQPDDAIVGLVLSIPLNESGWEQLIAGQLSESDVAPEHLFQPGRDLRLGIHIYHVEKRGTQPARALYGGPFVEYELRRLAGVVAGLPGRVSVIGVSGLGASQAGLAMLAGRLGMQEVGHCDEHVFRCRADGSLRIVQNPQPGQREQLETEGYEYSHRCQMLAVRPHMPSVVWSIFGR